MMTSSEDRAFKTVQEIGRINAFFPILQQLGNRWAATRPWEGKVVALNMHLTSLTACLIREMTLGGGTFVVTAANTSTTDPGTVDYLRGQGIDVYTGGDMKNRHLQALTHCPDFLVDVGFELVSTLLDSCPEQALQVLGAVEVTRTGITKLQARKDLPFPVMNINDGRLKNAVENRHGVGEAIWQAVTLLTGMHLSGRRVAVIGYGPVGKGLAAYARAAGMNVEVVETQPCRRLLAHYDGFPTPSLAEAMTRVGLAVTATGAASSISIETLSEARNGLVLLNAGHGGDEINVKAIRQASVSVDNVSNQVVRYQLESGAKVTILGNGHPLNIVLNSGSPEPVLLHFAVLGLALEALGKTTFMPGEVLVPPSLEDEAASLALTALNLAGG
jgi:adenosylhomocysteinase